MLSYSKCSATCHFMERKAGAKACMEYAMRRIVVQYPERGLCLDMLRGTLCGGGPSEHKTPEVEYMYRKGSLSNEVEIFGRCGPRRKGNARSGGDALAESTSEVACPQITTTSQHAAQVTNADVTSICGRRDVQSRCVSPDLSPDLSRWCRSFMSGHRSDICPQNKTHTSQVCSGATIAETNRESESIPAALV